MITFNGWTKWQKVDKVIMLVLLSIVVGGLAIAAAGCGGTSTAAEPPAVAATSDAPAHVYITWALSAPATTGTSATGAGPSLWSVAPEPGTLFGLTFRVPEVGFRFEIPRAWATGEPQDISTASLLAWFGEDPSASFTWSGTFMVTETDGRWSLHLDVTSDDGRRIVGTFGGAS